MAKVAGRFPSATLTLTVKFADKVSMPPIGWRNPYGDQTCALPAADFTQASHGWSDPGPAGITVFGADWAAACTRWEQTQVRYRAELTKLFERRWIFSPGASAGKAAIPKGDFDARLTRSGSPVLHRADLGNATGFEIPLPLGVLPPVNVLNPSSIYIAFQVADGSTTRAALALRAIDLLAQIATRWTDCDYPLEEGGPSDEKPKALGSPKTVLSPTMNLTVQRFRVQFRRSYWYFLQPGGTITDAFALANESVEQKGSDSQQEYPPQTSPVVEWQHRFARKISSDEAVCGPQLRYRAGNQSFDSDALIGDKEIGTHRLPDDSWLVTDGISVSPGVCRGDCVDVGYSVYRLRRTEGVEQVFDWSATLFTFERVVDAEIQRSADWNLITAYRKVETVPGSRDGAWSSERFCLRDGTYQSCGSGPSGAPPEPRQVVIP